MNKIQKIDLITKFILSIRMREMLKISHAIMFHLL
nr:MAG TPA: hypothetical protein [Caudoviricetes sp.]